MWTFLPQDVATQYHEACGGRPPPCRYRGSPASGGTWVATGAKTGTPPAELLHGSVPQTSSPRVDGLLREGRAPVVASRACDVSASGGWPVVGRLICTLPPPARRALRHPSDRRPDIFDFPKISGNISRGAVSRLVWAPKITKG